MLAPVSSCDTVWFLLLLFGSISCSSTFYTKSRHSSSDREVLLTDCYETPDLCLPEESAEQFPDPSQMVLQWENISVTVKSSSGYFGKKETLPAKQIISNVSGIALPGNLLAIMGASGSGKTTLLNALTLHSQRHLEVGGRVLVNGTPVTPREMDAFSAYVQQDDLFFGKLTVKEQLTFHALLRMDNSFCKASRLRRVDQVIRELGLTHCQDTLIGIPGRIQGISGGERRRLSFADEILSDPPIILCDEPTSGLDAASAQNIIVLLRKLASKGKTIICTIHQPSSHLYVLFDRIMIMAEGRLAFLGTSDEALSFFSSLSYPCPPNCCPADHFIHVLAELQEEKQENPAMEICKAFALTEAARAASDNRISQKWKKNTWIQNDKESASTSCLGAICLQYRCVFWRSYLGLIRDAKVGVIKGVAYVTLAFMMGLVYWNQQMDQTGVINVNSFFILFVLLLLVQNVFPTLHVLSEEMPVFRQENWNGMYSTGTYIICKSVAELPEFVVFPFLQVWITYSMIGIASDWHKVFFASGVIILFANSLVSFGYLVSSVNSSLGGTVALIPALAGPLINLSGNFINMKYVPWYFHWVQYLSMFKYSSEALFVNQWQDVTHIECNVENSTCPRNGHDILQLLDSDPDNISLDIIGLLALIVFYRLLAALVISIQVWRKQ